MAGGLDRNVAAVITIVGWLVSPIIGFLLPKILSRLGFDVDLEQKIQKELEFRLIHKLKNALRAVDTERLMRRGGKSRSELDALDKMAAKLRHARYEADDILDDAQEKIIVRDTIYYAVSTRIVRCLGFARVVQTGSARVLSLLRRFLGRRNVEMLKADLKRISWELHKLLLNEDGSHAEGRLGRLRMVPTTLRADMLKTILELRRLRPEDPAQGPYVIGMMLRDPRLLGSALVEDNADDSHFLDKMVVLLRRAEEQDNHDHPPHRLYVAVQACTARCMGIARNGSSHLFFF